MYPTEYAQEVFYKGDNQMKSLALAKPELTASLSLFFFLITHTSEESTWRFASSSLYAGDDRLAQGLFL